MSLRRRLVLGLLFIGAVLVVTNVALSNRFERFLVDRIDRQLTGVASSRLFEQDRPRRPGQPARGPQADDQTLSEYYIAIADPATGRSVRVGSALGDDRPAPVLDAATLTRHARRPQEARPFTAPATDGDSEWRLVALDSGPRDVVTVFGLSLAEVESTAARIRLVQILGTLAVLAALGLVTWWVLRLGVHPIEAMAGTADAIAAGDLSRRVEHPGAGTEAGRLGIAFNAMLERIQVAFREREASEERVRRFAADASHELRTPLTSIMGYAELYRAGGLRGRAELGDAMGRIEQEGRRMAALVEDLLLLARLDQRRAPERVPVRLDRLAADAVADARAVEPDRPVSLSVVPVVVDGDEHQLRQVVTNLVANARAHTPAGTPVRVTVSFDAGAAFARLEVADDGPGMAPDVAAHVFERFYRADPSRGRAAGAGIGLGSGSGLGNGRGSGSGSGLGLAIVAAIAEGHGGRAGVDAAPGAGSRFVIELPVRRRLTRRRRPSGERKWSPEPFTSALPATSSAQRTSGTRRARHRRTSRSTPNPHPVPMVLQGSALILAREPEHHPTRRSTPMASPDTPSPQTTGSFRPNRVTSGIVAGGAALAMVLAGLGIASAQTDAGSTTAEAPATPADGDGDGAGRPHRGHHHHAPRLTLAATFLDIELDELRSQLQDGKTLADIAGDRTDALVEALVTDAERHLDDAVIHGRLTQAEADERKAELPERMTTFVNTTRPAEGGRKARAEHGGPGARASLGTVASTLGITEDELRSRLRSGQSLAEIAGDRKAAVIDALVAEATARIDEAVTDGKLTAEQADVRKAALAERITAMVERTPPAPGERRGHRHGPPPAEGDTEAAPASVDA